MLNFENCFINFLYGSAHRVTYSFFRLYVSVMPYYFTTMSPDFFFFFQWRSNAVFLYSSNPKNNSYCCIIPGFTPYNDVTYPTTTQTVITDGQLWSFFAYQLNTVIPSKDNLLRNICWHSGEMKLFDEITDTEVQGLNDDILKILIKFYCNVPQSRQINLSPYLGEDNMTDEERSTLNYFWPRHYSNRPVEHKETPLYQYIYRENIERFIRRK